MEHRDFDIARFIPDPDWPVPRRQFIPAPTTEFILAEGRLSMSTNDRVVAVAVGLATVATLGVVLHAALQSDQG